MPALLQPKAQFAADAIVVGDPGRALLLAQELLTQPKMSNHARGLWGYSGRTEAGLELTIQSTGVGAPSAAAVLTDLAELGVRRAVRIGTCTALERDGRLGELLLVTEAVASEGSATALGMGAGTAVAADAALLARLRQALGGEAREARVLSLDTMPGTSSVPAEAAVAADMQTVAILGRGKALGVDAAALLIVAESGPHGEIDPAALEDAARMAGGAVAAALSP